MLDKHLKELLIEKKKNVILNQKQQVLKGTQGRVVTTLAPLLKLWYTMESERNLIPVNDETLAGHNEIALLFE